MQPLSYDEGRASSLRSSIRLAGGEHADLGRVLVVEDEYLIADDIARALATIGCSAVDLAPDMDQALLLIEQHRPDSAILDLNLRGWMVFPLADYLLLRNIPFVFLTGHERTVVPSGYNQVILCQKPIAPSLVVRALLRTVRQQAGHGSMFRSVP